MGLRATGFVVRLVLCYKTRRNFVAKYREYQMTKSIKYVLLIVLLSAPVSLALAGGDIEAGKAKAKTCVACHGVNGNSSNAEWPSLAGQGAAYHYKQLVELQKNQGRANELMAPMIKDLTEQDMLDLAAYYESLPQDPGVAQNAEVDLALGEAVYRGGKRSAGVPACIGCHGPAGKGNPAAKYPRVAGQHAVYTAIQLRNFRSAARANDENAMMRSVAHRMTDAEIDAVSQYIAGLNDAR